MPQYVVRPSVRLSVRLFVAFRYDFHTGWHNSKIISRLISLSLLLGLTQTWAIWSSGNTPKLEWNRGGVMGTKTCNISETVYNRTKVTMTD